MVKIKYLVNHMEEFQQQFMHMNAIKRFCQVIFFKLGLKFL